MKNEYNFRNLHKLNMLKVHFIILLLLVSSNLTRKRVMFDVSASRTYCGNIDGTVYSFTIVAASFRKSGIVAGWQSG